MVWRIALDLRVSFHEKRGIARYLINLTREFFRQKPQEIDLILLVPKPHLVEFQNIFSLNQNPNLVPLPETPIWHWEQFLLPSWCQKNKVGLLHMVTNRGPVFNWGFRKTHVIHDTISLHQTWSQKSFLKSLLSSTYNHLTIPRSARVADKIITVSNFSKELILKDLRVPEKKVSVIYNGVENQFFSPNKNCLNSFGLRDHGFIFHLGFLEPRKNTLRVIRAFANIKKELKEHYPLVIAGFSERAKEKMIPEIDYLGLKDDVILLPFISDAELACLYSTCSIFVWPSLWEGFGLPVIEAMASGAPVITSKTTSLPEVAGDAAILVDPESVEEISQAISYLLENPQKGKELSAKGKDRANNFKWSKTLEETVKVWREVLSSE